MKDGIRQIVGRRISGLIVKESTTGLPRNQVFLVFDDGTYFEFYGAHVQCASAVDPGDAYDVCRYMRSVDRWPILAALEDTDVQAFVDRDIALGQVVGHLSSPRNTAADVLQALDRVPDRYDPGAVRAEAQECVRTLRVKDAVVPRYVHADSP